MPLTLEQESKLAQLFMNNFDCYADSTAMLTPAMTKDRFISVLHLAEPSVTIPVDVLKEWVSVLRNVSNPYAAGVWNGIQQYLPKEEQK